MSNDVQNLRACHVCGVTINLRQCSKCRQVSYCGKEHQTKDWKTHKKICAPLSDICETAERLTLQISEKASSPGTN